MPVMNMIQALNSAMDVMLARDGNVVIFGEDVGYFGGVFRATEGLQKKYGLTRIFDAPIAEGGIMGTAVGMAALWPSNTANRLIIGSSWRFHGARSWSGSPTQGFSRLAPSSACSTPAVVRRCGWRSAISNHS